MTKVVCKCGIKRKGGFLYFVGKDGCAYETKMARGKKKGGGKKRVHDCRIKKEKGYLYFIDRKGNVCAAKMQRGGKKRKKR
ncbi:MAG: hypothetical protein A2Z72_02550 [Omnitrophica bacterium RBG_13_46_9]|nr:MAG: hypothetical protein A2Z72_02550 [Omnitrophica bacterium RBG_13_46_9]